MSILFSLQHIGFTVPPQSDAGWLGEVGPGPSYLDEGSGGEEVPMLLDWGDWITLAVGVTAQHADRGRDHEGGEPDQDDAGRRRTSVALTDGSGQRAATRGYCQRRPRRRFSSGETSGRARRLVGPGTAVVVERWG